MVMVSLGSYRNPKTNTLYTYTLHDFKSSTVYTPNDTVERKQRVAEQKTQQRQRRQSRDVDIVLNGNISKLSALDMCDVQSGMIGQWKTEVWMEQVFKM